MAFGEIDFIIVNRAGGVLVVEQKSGTLEEHDGGLTKRYRDGGTSDPVAQIHRSIGAIRTKFSFQNKGQGLLLDYLIYCPDHRLRNLNASAFDRSRVIDAAESHRLPERISALLPEGTESEPGHGARVRDFFAQSFDLVPDIHARLAAQEASYVSLSGSLLSFIGAIEMEPLRLRIRGAAGCGKSLVAAHLFNKARAAGRRPLLICFNRPLADRFIETLAPTSEGAVFTWYGLCAQFLKERGHSLDFGMMSKKPTFWRDVQELVVAEAISSEWLFDPIIVDEGQDFEPDWLDILRCFALHSGSWLWLEDPSQDVRRASPVVLAGFVGLRINDSLRTPQSIARFIRDITGVAFQSANPIRGLGVHVAIYEGKDDQRSIVAARVLELLRMGFKLYEIVILSLRGIGSTDLAGLNKVAQITLSRFSGNYTSDGQQIMTAGELLFETIARFKGKQSPAIIVVDVDDSHIHSERGKALLFTAFTRATLRLEVLGRRGDEITARMLSALRQN